MVIFLALLPFQSAVDILCVDALSIIDLAVEVVLNIARRLGSSCNFYNHGSHFWDRDKL